MVGNEPDDASLANLPPASAGASGDATRAELEAATPVLTPSEVDAICSYRSIGYVAVNRILRGQDDPATYEEDELRRINEIIDGLDTAAEKASLTSSITVYRGVTDVSSLFPGVALGALSGAEFTEPAFLSTTVDPEVARRIFVADGAPPSALLELVVPAGTHVIWVTAVDPGTAPDEQEVLLSRGATLRVTHIDLTEELPMIRAEVTA